MRVRERNILDTLCRAVGCLSVVYAETADIWWVSHPGGRDGGIKFRCAAVRVKFVAAALE
jgi:hypothetical protein